MSGLVAGFVAAGAMAAVLVAGAVFCGSAMAAQPPGLVIAQTNACLGCHVVDRKLVGPSFVQIAEKYKGDAGAAGKLQAKVRDGGAGVWGVVPMPAHPRMNSVDIKTVVDWVLAGAPQK